MSNMSEIVTKEIVTEDNEDRKIIYTEYWQDNKMIQRDVIVVVKKMPELFGTTIPDGIPLEN